VITHFREFQSDSHDVADTIQSIKFMRPLLLDAVKRTIEQAENGFVAQPAQYGLDLSRAR